MPQPWIKRNKDSIVSGLFVSAVFAAVTYLAAKASPLLAPVFYGFIAGAAALVGCTAVMVARRLPKQPPVSEANIERCIREWLDNFKVTVKNDPNPDLYFCLRITVDSGVQMTILRSKSEYTEYFSIIAHFGMGGEEAKQLLGLFTDGELAQLLLNVKTELSRAKVGYGGLELPPDNFHIFRRVPILPALTEFGFMAMIGDIEAAFNLVMLCLASARLKQIKPAAEKPTPIENLLPKVVDKG